MRSPLFLIFLAGTLVAALSSCSAPSTPPDSPSNHGGDNHGAITGAAELAEPALGLTTIDPAGNVSHLNLLDEVVTPIGAVRPPVDMTTDGRYLFAETDAGIEIIDSGVWTWDHGDHFHYYQGEAKLLGTVEGQGPANIATTNLSSTGGTGLSFSDSGDAVLLDTEALSRGDIVERFRLSREPHDGLIVPVGSFSLVTEAEDGVGVSVAAYNADGERTGAEELCAAPSGTITTRVGAVIGCDEGALLAYVSDGDLIIERIPYPANTTAAPASSFDNREGRPTVAGLSSTGEIWLLDTRGREWKLLTAPVPLAHVTAVDDQDENLLALAQDGRVLILSANDGSVIAETEPLVAASLASGQDPALIADQQRAYLSNPLEQKLYEIDYADDARIARTFETTSKPMFTAETGR